MLHRPSTFLYVVGFVQATYPSTTQPFVWLQRKPVITSYITLTFKKLASIINAVSYTHLDVYKRQLYC